MTTTNSIKFRSKFEKLLNDDNREAVTSAFEKFCSGAFYSALDILWELTYKTDASEVLKKLELNEIFSSENVLSLRNELRYQFENAQGKFSDAIIFRDGIKDAYDMMKKVSDAVTAYVVYERCVEATYSANIERTLYLLGSAEEKNFFGGIRSLQFEKKEAEYLKNFHLEIQALFKAICEVDNLILKEGCVETNVPEKKKDESGDYKVQIEMHQTEESSVETPIEEPAKSTYKPLTPEEILSHKDEFAAFVYSEGDLNRLVEIAQLGFDVNVVNTKAELIKEFLDIVTLLAN